MRRYLLIISLLTLPAWSDVIITSGSLTSHTFGSSSPGGFWIPSFAGSNFSISGSSGLTLNGFVFPNAPDNCVFATATCSYNFTQSVSNAIAGPATDGSHITYNGTSYAAPDIIRFAFNFVSSSVSGAGTCFHDPSAGNVCAAPAFGAVAFTMTGSFTIEGPGGVILASDVLSGSGTASTSGTPASGEGNVGYTFTSTPEPASLGLVGAGLLLTGWLARRQLARV